MTSYTMSASALQKELLVDPWMIHTHFFEKQKIHLHTGFPPASQLHVLTKAGASFTHKAERC